VWKDDIFIVRIACLSSAVVIPADRFASSRLSAGEGTNPITLLRDIDQPFIFEVKLGEKDYRLEFFDTSSPDNWRTLQPDVVTICFDISQRLTLIQMKRYVRIAFPELSVFRLTFNFSGATRSRGPFLSASTSCRLSFWG
jgi:hypothetical protein